MAAWWWRRGHHSARAVWAVPAAHGAVASEWRRLGSRRAAAIAVIAAGLLGSRRAAAVAVIAAAVLRGLAVDAQVGHVVLEASEASWAGWTSVAVAWGLGLWRGQ